MTDEAEFDVLVPEKSEIVGVVSRDTPATPRFVRNPQSQGIFPSRAIR